MSLLPHPTLQHQSADMAQQLRLVKGAESSLQETIQSLQRQLADVSEAVTERERRCQPWPNSQIISNMPSSPHVPRGLGPW
jgi:TolA-binding protein